MVSLPLTNCLSSPVCTFDIFGVDLILFLSLISPTFIPTPGLEYSSNLHGSAYSGRHENNEKCVYK